MTPATYAKNEIKAGRFPSMMISAGQNGTFWLDDAEFKTLENACFMSREAAEQARSKAIDKAMKWAA